MSASIPYKTDGATDSEPDEVATCGAWEADS